MSNQWKKVVLSALLVSALSTGCGGKLQVEEGADATAISISGTLAGGADLGGARVSSSGLVSERSFARLSGPALASVLNQASVELDLLSVYCVTFQVPPVTGTAKVAANGKFAVKLAGAKGQPFGCFVLQNESVVASLVFKDSAEKKMDGSVQTTPRAAFDADASFGTIVLDIEKGTAVADLGEVAVAKKPDVVTAAAFDPSGVWTIKRIDFELPMGYKTACAAGEECKDLAENMTIFLKRLDGFKVIDGVTTADRAYGLMMWHSEAAFQACGSKLGFSYADAKLHGGIDLSGSGIAEGPFDFNPAYQDGWKNVASARSNYEIRDCGPTSVVIGGVTQSGWKCFDNDGNYQVSVGGGCVNTANNEPVRLNNWAGLNEHSQTDLGNGFIRYENSGDLVIDGQSIHVKCTSTNATFLANGSSCTQDGHSECYDWNNSLILATQNQLCSEINTSSPRGQLSQLQCYANYYYSQNRDSLGCVRDIQTDWSAQTPEQFLVETGPARANQQGMIERLKYSSPTEAVVHQEEETTRGVPMADGSYINCRVFSTKAITVKKLSDSKLLIEFIESNRNLSMDRPACVAEMSNRSEKGMFYLVK